jgi:murein DD-endopeptidase MepM/ murein hydrolase activator NlpD
MALPAIGALAKGLLGAGARTAATGGARAMAGQAAKGAAKQGFKKFAQGMTGRSSADYQSRVQGINPDTGEYLTPEERKARFKGFATATKPGSQKLLSGGPTQTVTALPPAGGVGAAADNPQQKTVDHLAKIQMYLEKLLGIEENALNRLQDRILATAREDEKDAAASEEAGMEAKKDKPKKTNPIVQGMKKKAQGIFGLLMDLGMKFVGFKILEWIGKEENQEKVQKIIEFFQGVVGFITTVGTFLGDAWNFSVDVITQGIEGIKFMAGKVKDFFSFEWLDIDALLEPLQPVIEFFTTTIPEAFGGFVDGLANVVDAMDKLPEQFVGIVDQITSGFLGFLGLGPSDTKEFDPPDKSTPVPDNGFLNSDPESKDIQPIDDKSTVAQQAAKDNAETMAAINNPFREGGRIPGGTHGQGGVNINAEGGEYVLNRRAVAAIGSAALDRINFDRYPAVGKNGGKAPGSVRKYGAGGAIQYFSVNDGSRNKKLQDNNSYRYTDLLQHHGAPEGVGKGAKRMDGWPKDYTLLKGPNLATSPNADLPTPVAGEVIYKKPTGASGNVLVVKGDGGAGNFAYSHLSKFANLEVGDRVQKGEIIGTQGKSGGNYAEHLHLDAEKKGHEAFVNYITGGGPLKGRSAADDQPNSATTPNEGNTTDTTAEKLEDKRTPEEKFKQRTMDTATSIVEAAALMADLLGGPVTSKSDILKKLQEENNISKTPGDEKTETTVVTEEEGGSVNASVDQEAMMPTLGDNIPPVPSSFFGIKF